MKSFSLSEPVVALCSLHSWTYTVLPKGSLNLHDALVNIGNTLSMLAPPETAWAPLQQSDDPVSIRAGQRMQDGYTMVRQRTQTGEVTAGLYRGPFVPTQVLHPLSAAWTSQSMFSTDFQ